MGTSDFGTKRPFKSWHECLDRGINNLKHKEEWHWLMKLYSSVIFAFPGYRLIDLTNETNAANSQLTLLFKLRHQQRKTRSSMESMPSLFWIAFNDLSWREKTQYLQICWMLILASGYLGSWLKALSFLNVSVLSNFEEKHQPRRPFIHPACLFSVQIGLSHFLPARFLPIYFWIDSLWLVWFTTPS